MARVHVPSSFHSHPCTKLFREKSGGCELARVHVPEQHFRGQGALTCEMARVQVSAAIGVSADKVAMFKGGYYGVP